VPNRYAEWQSVAPSIGENEQTPLDHRLAQHLLHVSREPIKTAAQIHWRHCHEDPRRRGQGNEHGRRKHSTNAWIHSTSVPPASRTVVPSGHPTSALQTFAGAGGPHSRTSWNSGALSRFDDP
jgi:hypothetical protein